MRKTTIDNKTAKTAILTISAHGLTDAEQAEIEKVVKRIKRKRSHEKRPRLHFLLNFVN